MDGIATYARTYNQMIADAQRKFGVRDRDSGMLVHRDNGETLLPIREILFSGGDALTLPNATIARYLAMMAESGLKTVRFGTKEFIFNLRETPSPAPGRSSDCCAVRITQALQILRNARFYS